MVFMEKTPKICFCLPESEWVDLKIICVLTHKTMSEFIRISIKEKIKNVKSN